MPWVIRSKTDDELYWSNSLGWGDARSADEFSEGEKSRINVPIDGEWIFSHVEYIVVIGRPIDGLRFVGSFPTREEAIDYAEEYEGPSGWCVAPMSKVKTGDLRR